MWRGKSMKEVTVEVLDNYVIDLRPGAGRQVPSATVSCNESCTGTETETETETGAETRLRAGSRPS